MIITILELLTAAVISAAVFSATSLVRRLCRGALTKIRKLASA